MKKRLLTALAVISLSFTQAQEVKFGTKVGLNISTLRGDINYTKYKTGFHVGGFVEIKVSDNFFLQPEILYSKQGTKSEQKISNYGQGLKINYTQDLSYLNIPVMAKIHITESFYIEAGPQISFLLDAEQKGEATGIFYGEAINETETINNKNNLSSTDFAANLGIGFNFSEKIGASLRYSAGISDIDKESRTSEIYNGNFGLSILYSL